MANHVIEIAKIQLAHTNDPSVYYFKDFAPSDAPEGFRGCPGWYDEKCCSTWKNAAPCSSPLACEAATSAIDQP